MKLQSVGYAVRSITANVLQLGDGAKFGIADFRLPKKLMRNVNVMPPLNLPYCQIAVMPSVFRTIFSRFNCRLRFRTDLSRKQFKIIYYA